MQRKFGEFAGFWRMGIQKRGAWHFHLLLFVGPSIGSVDALRRFISSSWYEVTGKVSEGHLRAGTRVVAVRRWREVTSYVERYMAKPEEFPEGLRTGRIWGVWNEELLPVQWETVQVSLRDALKIRRIYRKLARRKGSGSLGRITVFVRYENVVRLLTFFGYCLEQMRYALKHHRSIIHVVPTPSRDALRVLKAVQNGVVADEGMLWKPEELTGWEKPSKRLVPASRAGRPGLIDEPGVLISCYLPGWSFPPL